MTSLPFSVSKFPRTPHKIIQFTQPGLIDQILCDVNITTFSKGKDTPCDSILHPDPDGPACIEQWNYRSI
ncbi:MAG: hypothetical protein ACK53Y_10860, partial [bacterium]